MFQLTFRDNSYRGSKKGLIKLILIYNEAQLIA